ncbi:helix-turn-helix domain-containing protein [Arachidicoccus terrestris]|uniref:helix-turn-helix domain-containing protein n=1 Tax=Arachidicoccus terrestris TaxID=2875539 RepID=UPI001CC6DBC4|nr:AraC family transcriptional regulator [Arachidicoccus terrestris]UAY55312.1 helix-turn-helix transcriptional regulator [Arachidicoccus terrestris]
MVQLTAFQDLDLCNQAPTRLLVYRLVYCQSGSTGLHIDETEFTMQSGQVITITSGQVHYFTALRGQIQVLDFALEFICKDDSDIELIFHNGLFCHFGENELISLRDPALFENLLDKSAAELEQKPFQYLITVRSYIELLLIEINRTKIANGDPIWKPDALFLKFLESVRSTFEKNYTVSDYARLLSTTETRLNEAAKQHTSKTAQNVIFSLKISEAKRILLYQDQSIKEVAYALGFSDPFYFSNFFKKHTGTSPKEYKKAHIV